MPQLISSYSSSSGRLKIFQDEDAARCEDKGYYIEIGENANTREDFFYAKLLHPLFYLEVINSGQILEEIGKTRELETRTHLRLPFEELYLCALINHFIEHNTINEEYFRAIDSLWDLSKPDQSQADARKKVLQTLLKVHIRSDFTYSEKSADVIEGRVFNIVFDDKARQPIVREELRDEGQLLKAQRWFLARYDVRSARTVSASIKQDKPGSERHDEKFIPKALKRTRVSFWSWMNAALIIFGVLAWATQDPLLALLQGKTELVERILSTRKLILGLLLYVLPIVVIWWRVYKNRVWYQTLLPRLLCGVILGYLLLLSGEAWGACYVCLNHGLFGWAIRSLIRVCLPLALAFGYLYIEINNEIKGFKISSGFSYRRAWSIWLQGVFYALLIGLILSDFFGEGIIGETNHYYFEGAIGRIYPFNVIFLSPLALFIGIFAQLIWEDKAITHPL